MTRWTESPIFKIGWLESLFYKAFRRRNVPPSFRVFNRDDFGFDISYYQGAVNFQKMKDYGAKFLIPRCGYKDVKDLRFDEYMTQSDGLFPTSVYHYYDPLVDPVRQANKVVATLLPYKSRIRRVWGDLEFPWTGAYQDAKHWKTYRDIIKAAGYKWGWYTRATWWDSRVGTFAADFASDPVWAAQYNIALTLIPKGWTKAHIWQQGTPSIGFAAGVSTKEIDYDLWNSDFDFNTEWGVATTPQPSDVISNPYDGTERITGTRYGWQFVLHKVDPKLVRFGSVYNAPKNIASNVGKNEGATLVWNGGEHDWATGDTINYTVVDGIVEILRTSAQPSLMITESGKVLIDHKAPTDEKVMHALTGLRYLVGTLADPAQWNTEGHARRVFGKNVAGHLLSLGTEGIAPPVMKGWTLQQCRDFMIEQGAVVAADFGGGGDVSEWDKLEGLLLTPENPGGLERYLPNHLLVYAQEQTNMAKNKVTITWDAGAREREKPRINAADSYGAVLADNSVHYSDFDIVPDVDDPTNPNKKWIQLQSKWYVAVKYPPTSGTIYERAKVEAIAPPPATFEHHLQVILDGVVEWEKKFN